MVSDVLHNVKSRTAYRQQSLPYICSTQQACKVGIRPGLACSAGTSSSKDAEVCFWHRIGGTHPSMPPKGTVLECGPLPCRNVPQAPGQGIPGFWAGDVWPARDAAGVDTESWICHIKSRCSHPSSPPRTHWLTLNLSTRRLRAVGGRTPRKSSRALQSQKERGSTQRPDRSWKRN